MQPRCWDLNLKVRLIGEALFNMLFWMYFPFMTIHFSSTFGPRFAGFLMTLPSLFSMLGSLVGGALADRIGRRPVMLLGTGIQTVMFALFAMSLSPWIDYFAFLLIGVGGAIYRPAGTAMVADLVPESQRREVFATFATANNVGAVIGPVFGAVFFFRHRPELLWTCTGVLLLYFFAIWILATETLPRSDRRAKRKSFSPARTIREQWSGYGIIFRDKVFLVYLLAGIFSLISIMQLDLYVAVYVTEYIPAQALFPWMEHSPRLTGTEIFGWMVGLNGLLFVLFIIPVTKWFRHSKERNVFILSSLLSGCGTFALMLNHHLWFLFFVTVIFTFGEIIRSPVQQSFISRYAPEHARGQYLGADSLQYAIAKFLAPLTVILSGWMPPPGVFSLILTCSLIGSVLYVKLFRMRGDHGKAVACESSHLDRQTSVINKTADPP
ncbi:MDR family MFS transporter [Staphylospora marina]|uniref:MDR family MFS transporter n=1 Tax=Staphylospora marina TaxID=2490858 RepID=UPI000F5C262D|nr:MFS transporter [Staphylospora marina]